MSAETAYQAALRRFKRGQFTQARKLLLDLRQSQPRDIAVLRLLGLACGELGRQSEAVQYLTAVAAQDPSGPNFFNLGKAQQLARLFTEALKSYDAGLQLMPNEPRLLQARASVLTELGDFGTAITAFRDVIRREPASVEARANLGETLLASGAVSEAITELAIAVKLDPDNALTLGSLIRAKQLVCDWDQFDAIIARLLGFVAKGQPTNVFNLLTITDDPAAQKAAAVLKARTSPPAPASSPFSLAHMPRDGRMRVAYVSADFRNHPQARLMDGVLRAHDRAAFEIFAVAVGRNDHSDDRRSIENAVDVFVDLEGSTNADIVDKIRKLNVHIAVDLMGYTRGYKPGVFEARVAPVQINFLGFPGTLGMETIDHIIADHFVLPEHALRDVTEKPVFLPHTYYPNGYDRPKSCAPRSRSEWGLPDTGFVFCCLNNTWKISPQIFAAWMRVLAAVDDSVLWLYAPEREARENLGREARRHGISEGRIIFADAVDQERYFARFQAADLFLDTFPYGAHTTGVDALWMGCPVITLIGRSFASRVCGSFLEVLKVPQFITSRLADYEALAIELARNPQALAAYKDHLVQVRDTTPLFDLQAYTRGLEVAYRGMCQRVLAGRKAEAIDVPQGG